MSIFSKYFKLYPKLKMFTELGLQKQEHYWVTFHIFTAESAVESTLYGRDGVTQQSACIQTSGQSLV